MYSNIKQGLKSQRKTLALTNFGGGLVTNIPVQKLEQDELSSCVNFRLNKLGGIQSRQGLTKYNNTVFPSNVVAMTLANINSVNYELFACSDQHLYYLDGSKDPVLIPGTLSGIDVQLIGYNDVVVILDGSHIKYWDGSGDVKICYDDGSGTKGFQFDHSSGMDDGSTSLYTGATTRVAAKFTSQTWDTGFTINPISITAELSKVLSPTGNVTATIRKVSDDSVIATKTMTTAVDLTTMPLAYTVTYESTDITSPMDSATDYYCCIEYSGGDASNYVQIHHSTATAGSYYSYNGSWAADITKEPLMSLKPGISPKSLFGDVKVGRLYTAGDPNNLGHVWYSNMSHLDWSTPAGGGWVGAVDDGANSYAIGAISTLYGDLYIIGRAEQPFISKLTGAIPEDYALPPTFQRVSTIHKTIISTINNLFFCSADGVKSLRGVEQYGDLRSFNESDAIENKIVGYWSDNAFAGYNPVDSQYFLKLEGYSKVLVCHTGLPHQKTGKFPWAEYRFYKENLSDIDIYEWHESAVLGEFYVTGLAGVDPQIALPEYLILDDMEATKDTIGSMVANTWNHGDNDTLGFNTIYVGSTTIDVINETSIKTVLTPISFGSWGSKFFVAGDNKNIYCLDDTIIDDNQVSIRYELMSAYFMTPFAKTCLERCHLDVSSEFGGGFNFKIYTDYNLTVPIINIPIDLSIIDGLTVDQLGNLIVNDARFNIDIGHRITEWLNVNAESFMMRIDNLVLNGKPFYMNSIILENRKVFR